MAEYKKALVTISMAGTANEPREDKWISEFREALALQAIKSQFVDTVLNWGCLNQDWLEFVCDVESSWGWCELKLSSENRDWNSELKEKLHSGVLIMQVHPDEGKGVHL